MVSVHEKQHLNLNLLVFVCDFVVAVVVSVVVDVVILCCYRYCFCRHRGCNTLLLLFYAAAGLAATRYCAVAWTVSITSTLIYCARKLHEQCDTNSFCTK